MENYLHDYCLIDNRFQKCNQVTTDHSLIGGSVYEVIRVTRSVLLFFEDHFDRLKESAQLAGIRPLPDSPGLKQKLHELIQKNGGEDGNIRLDLFPGDPELSYSARYIPHRYPSEEEYIKGVKAILIHAERPNPGVKAALPEFRRMINESLRENQAYEALLVDSKNNITEGSRSNFFVIRDNEVFTPPAGTVLEGITRKKIFDICRAGNIPLIERKIKISDLQGMDGVFITGTSPKILPVANIGTIEFKTRLPLLRQLINTYDEMIESYILNHE